MLSVVAERALGEDPMKASYTLCEFELSSPNKGSVVAQGLWSSEIPIEWDEQVADFCSSILGAVHDGMSLVPRTELITTFCSTPS